MADTLEKRLYKLEIWVIKVLPFILAILNFINTIFATKGIIVPILSYLSTVTIIPFVFLYLTSFVFKFCIWHRFPLYYIALNSTINLCDYYWLSGLSDTTMIIIYSFIFGIFTIFGGILKFLNKKFGY